MATIFIASTVDAAIDVADGGYIDKNGDYKNFDFLLWWQIFDFRAALESPNEAICCSLPRGCWRRWWRHHPFFSYPIAIAAAMLLSFLSSSYCCCCHLALFRRGLSVPLIVNFSFGIGPVMLDDGDNDGGVDSGGFVI